MSRVYEYGTVETFETISGQASYYGLGYAQGPKIARLTGKAREFYIYAMAFFHEDAVSSRRPEAEEAMIRRFRLLDQDKQWRQGASTHQLVVWPEEPDPSKIIIDGYYGEDAEKVGDFKHGVLTWFSIMAWAWCKDRIREKA